MFLFAGISAKVKPAGLAMRALCPVCGYEKGLHLTHKYMTPHIFFIPTFRFHSTYLATCPHCASIMELDRDAARRVRDNPDYPVQPFHLHVVQGRNPG